MVTVTKSNKKAHKVAGTRKKSKAKMHKYIPRKRSPKTRSSSASCASNLELLFIGFMFGLGVAVVLIKGEPVEQTQGLKTQGLPGRNYRPQRHDVILS